MKSRKNSQLMPCFINIDMYPYFRVRFIRFDKTTYIIIFFFLGKRTHFYPFMVDFFAQLGL